MKSFRSTGMLTAADTAASVGEAKRMLGGKQYQLCLTDMRLPDGNGIDLCPKILEYSEQAKIIFITGYPNIEQVVVLTRGDVNRSRLYYLRQRVGKAARIKEKRTPHA